MRVREIMRIVYITILVGGLLSLCAYLVPLFTVNHLHMLLIE